MPESALAPAFAALPRVYGARAAALLPELRFCVVGVGGVGSWAAEALVRTGVGHVTMIDHDDVAIGNVNRQLHAFPETVGRSKVTLMAERLRRVSPGCEVVAEDDFLVERNLERYLDRDFDAVVDAIDGIRFKAALIAFCRRRKIRVVTTGGAGGRTDPTAVTVGDLSRTAGCALAAKVRARLRAEHGFSSNPRRSWGVDCVHSREQPLYPDGEGGVGHARPGRAGLRLDCEQGYGSTVFVTATFGFAAASRALDRALGRRLRAASGAAADEAAGRAASEPGSVPAFSLPVSTGERPAPALHGSGGARSDGAGTAEDDT